MQYNAIPCNTMQYHAIPCNTMQYYAIQCNPMQYHAIPWIINKCWRSVPLPCGQYNGHFFIRCCHSSLDDLVFVIILDIGRGNEISNNSCWVGQLHPLSKASGPNGVPHIKVKQASRGEQLSIIDFPLIFILDWETQLLLWPCTRCCIIVLHKGNKKHQKIPALTISTKTFSEWS